MALDPEVAACPLLLFQNHPGCPLSLKTGLYIF